MLTKNDRNICLKRFLLLFLISHPFFSYSQQTSQSSLAGDSGISVLSTQNMAFGAFSHGADGGTISIAPDGSRSVTGTVNAFNIGVGFFQAIFEIEAESGSIISILNGPDVTLSGSNGGTMLLHIGNSFPVSPFNIVVAPPQKTSVNIGGTLTVGSGMNNPPGTYTGTLYITFNQE